MEEASEEESETQITAVSPDLGMRDLRRRKKAKTIVLADHPNYESMILPGGQGPGWLYGTCVSVRQGLVPSLLYRSALEVLEGQVARSFQPGKDM